MVVKDAAPAQHQQLTVTNAFALLGNKKIKDPKPRSEKKQQEGGTAASKKPKKEGKVFSLAEEQKKLDEKKPEEKPPPPKEDKPKAAVQKDRHVDRSLKGDHQRKAGQGKGGWDDTIQHQQDAPPAETTDANDWGDATASWDTPTAADDGKAPAKEVREESNKQQDREAEEEARRRREEEKQMTLDEYLAKKSGEGKVEAKKLDIRKVDASQFKNMFKVTKEDEDFMKISKKPAPKPAKNVKAPPKQTQKPKEPEAKKEKITIETGFRVGDNTRAPGRGGKGGGRGGRGKGRDGEGRGYDNNNRDFGAKGEGRGNRFEGEGERPSAAVEDDGAGVAVDSKEEFPDLGKA
eukprot:NODE_118_length_1474_cov_262.092632_g88_i0.p1 GENE.NODE_118_length_1474_cov_262.092632_g88_i0~~NODE_118_length_1474_cov_262.092632_g88_i0.p1  ORF type:complete len:349 (-),score=140.03 NODE_118_length_1474_cov_262.092632_g88_i0:331-1377(-)